MSALKSQLEVMSGAVKTIAPQSAIARFIYGDLKGGEHKHDYTMSVISAAIEQAYKGNTRDIPEAVALCTGKSAKSKAYHAGFHAIADMVKPIIYTGKLADAGNASVREAIANMARSASCEFELAYLASIQNGKVESAFNRKAKAKTAPVVAAAVASEAPVANPLTLADSIEIDIATSVDAVVQALTGGLLSPTEIYRVRAALSIMEDNAERAAQFAALPVQSPMEHLARDMARVAERAAH
jgi:hypothetical protein